MCGRLDNLSAVIGVGRGDEHRVHVRAVEQRLIALLIGDVVIIGEARRARPPKTATSVQREL